ncbi:MAG: S41 family peptidase [Planctomycetota bacterium]|nr:S41 family peptidase [Planctomycetota bacterium]
MTIARRGVLGALIVLACLAGACGTRPARTDVAPTPARPLSGEYIATLHTTYVGPLRFRMAAEPTPDGFKANTPPGVAWDRMGGLERLLGPVVAPYLFPRGMILTWESELPTDDGPGQGSIGVGTMDVMRIRTRMTSMTEPIEVRFRDGRLIALLTLEREPASWSPPDYPALAASIREAMPATLFNPSLARGAQVRRYLADLEQSAALARDDAEFLFGAFFAARANLKITAPLMYPRDDALSRALFAGRAATPQPYRVVHDPATGICTVQFDAFIDDALVDRAFLAALAPAPKAVILDLRSCSGVDLSSLRAASWLIGEPLDAGVYFSGAARDQTLDERGRTAGSITFGPTDASPDLTARLETMGAARITVQPREGAFTGPLVVLTSSRTSSTGESLAIALGASRAMKVIGERTAGKPLLAREADLGQGWALRVAGYDYLSPDGESYTGNGYSPDIRTSREVAPRRATGVLRAALGLPEQPDEPDTGRPGPSEVGPSRAGAASTAGTP